VGAEAGRAWPDSNGCLTHNFVGTWSLILGIQRRRRTLPASQLELLKMGQTGELKQLWDAASVTNVRINLVRICVTPSGPLGTQRTGMYVVVW